ncbi:MAG: ABC transporter substrate-binding protein [Peptococcaceae bacterium]|nr:ABC transporter substrate-binding protein [Peptococcaceae bacterium]
MKEFFKKAAIAGLAAAVFLTGCSPSVDGESSSPSPDAGNKKKTVIEYWNINSESVGGKTVKELIDNFNAINDHIEVVNRYNAEEYKGLMQNLQAEEAAGNAPAIVQVGWTYLNYFANNFSYTQPQEIIDQFFPEDTNFLSDNFLSNVLELAVTSDGKQVGIPYSLSTPVLFYNADLLKQAGLSEAGPKTWEEVISFSKQVKEKTGSYGFYTKEGPDSWTQQAMIESNGGKMITMENGKAKATFASEEGIAAFQAYANMVLADKSAIHASWDEGFQAFLNGKVAMLHTTIAYMASIEKNATFDVRAVSSPVWEGKKRVVPAGGCFLAITAKGEEQKKAAWEFMKYLYRVESMAAWTEGTGYVPPRKDVIESENGLKEFVEENQMFNAAASQMDGVASWASFPGDAGLQAEQMLIDIRDQILNGSIGARTGLIETQDKINELLASQ